jgi:hypothetical protein
MCAEEKSEREKGRDRERKDRGQRESEREIGKER